MTRHPNSLLTEVRHWLDRQGHSSAVLTALDGDVSPRRYLRSEAAGGGSSIVAVYPASMLDVAERFLETTRLLTAAGIEVPSILAWDPAAGLMLLSDAGRGSVFEAVRKGRKPAAYWHRAIALLDGLARLDPAAVKAVNKPLAGATLRRELEQSWDLVLEPQGLTGEGSLGEDFRRRLTALCDHLAEPDPRPCHRDFMARNLLLDRHDEIVVIDHQDLRLGPPWYDLASLLNDTLYVEQHQEADLLERAGVPQGELEMYHRAAAQRALKIVGTFTAFAARGAPRYLPLVPASLAAARRHLAILPETTEVMRHLGPIWDAILGPNGPLTGEPSLLD